MRTSFLRLGVLARNASVACITFLREPTFALEIALWVLLAGVTIGVRVYLWHLLPVYAWSGDAESYAHPAFRWIDTGQMIFDGRRGPIYTLLIAAALKLFGELNAVVWFQHGLIAIAILAAVIVARLWWGRVSVVPLFVCGVALGLYGLPLHFGQVIRNESLLFVFSTAAFGCWWLALSRNSKAWLFGAALSAGLLTMTKNVFVPFPFMLVAGVLFFERLERRARITRVTLIVAGFALPFIALKIRDATARHVAPPEPQAGILFYGRTAQWTKLEGGIEPELKALIRAEVEEYRQRPKLDNNIVIKRTIVPHLWRVLKQQGKSAIDLDRLCGWLAIEAVRAQPGAFWRQVCGDLYILHIESGVENAFPNEHHLWDAQNFLRDRGVSREAHPSMQVERSENILWERMGKGSEFRVFHRLLNRAWLFEYYPVLLTTLSLLIMVSFTRSKERLFFLGMAAVWFFNMLLLSTVGRPQDRYLMPLVPLMFWSMSGVFVLFWNWLLGAASRVAAKNLPFRQFAGLRTELPSAGNGNTSFDAAIFVTPRRHRPAGRENRNS